MRILFKAQKGNRELVASCSLFQRFDFQVQEIKNQCSEI